MALGSKLDTVVLRATSYPPSTNKGSKLTHSELDINQGVFLDLLLGLMNPGGIANYNAGTTYSLNDYVRYGGELYIYIYATPASGKQPDTNPTYWTWKNPAVLIHQHINSSVLAATEESFTTALKGVYDNAATNGLEILPMTVTTGDLISLNSTPFVLVPVSGATQYTDIISITAFLAAGGTVYNFVADLIIQFTSLGSPVFTLSKDCINSAVDCIYKLVQGSVTDSQLALQDSVEITSTANPTQGDGTLYLNIIYKTITL